MFTRTTALIAAGGVLAGAAVVGIPALVVAATNDDERPGPGRFVGDEDWQGRGFGPMHGRRGQMMGGGPGFGGGFGFGPRGGMMGGPLGWGQGEPAGELTDAQADALALNAEHAKLARDLSTAFADATGDVRFRHLAQAGSHHLRALQAMLDVYEVTDPTAGNGPGEFADDAVAADYQALLEEGSGSEDAALEVARELADSDADRLDDTAEDVEDDAADLSRVYEHLALAAERRRYLLDQ
ncbi:MAG: DUF2202 domain-containing protein [Actinomycetes bacterium]